MNAVRMLYRMAYRKFFIVWNMNYESSLKKKHILTPALAYWNNRLKIQSKFRYSLKVDRSYRWSNI